MSVDPEIPAPAWVKGKKIIPCDHCISVLRKKLFKLKTDNGMIAYRDVVELAKWYLHDMYSGSKPEIIWKNRDQYNIEHVVIAKIVGPRPTDESFPFINKEPYHDCHLLFPTKEIINTLRANFVYGKVADTREDAIKKSMADVINVDEIALYDLQPDNKIPASQLRQTATISLDKSRNDDIFVTNKNSVIIEGDKEDYIFCDIGKCLFQPSKNFSGDLARVVFYFLLMYAYDVTERPYTGETPWIGNVSREKKCQGFDFNAWKAFFHDHIDDFYDWAKTDPVNDIETRRNKEIIGFTSVPNIFVGYTTKDGTYHTSTMDVIDELFFGKPHDHEKYTGIEFDAGKKYMHWKTREPIAYDYIRHMKEEGKLYEKSMMENDCMDIIRNINLRVMKEQRVLYGNPNIQQPLIQQPANKPLIQQPANKPLIQQPQAVQQANKSPIQKPIQKPIQPPVKPQAMKQAIADQPPVNPRAIADQPPVNQQAMKQSKAMRRRNRERQQTAGSLDMNLYLENKTAYRQLCL
jgi:endonuclease I